MNFEQRVELAQDRLEGGLVWGEGPVLDELDAAIVLVGHSYRRDAHHYDTHNPAVIGPLGRVMFAARAHVHPFAVPRPLHRPSAGRARRARPLRRDSEGLATQRDRAARATAKMLVGLEIDVVVLGEAFAVDLEIASRAGRRGRPLPAA